MQSGTVQIDKSSNTITGGGTYSGNWNATPWQMYVAVKFDKIPKEIGVWDGAGLTSDKTSGISSGNNQRLGAYVKFDTVANEEIKVKVAISFTSTDKALEYLNEQLPDWDFEAVRNRCAEKWNEILHGVELGEADNSVKSRFYSALFFANVHPRDRVDDHGTWDDYYTVWDSWKSVFPFLTLTRPDVISDNVNSFIKRFAENGMMTDAYIQGKEFLCGQGGNDIENIIADAYIKNISGVDWERAYAAVKGNSEVLRSAQYISHGYQYDGDRKAINGMSYSYRLYPSSATMGFAYNDYAVSVMAKGLGKTDDAKFFARRSENWKSYGTKILSRTVLRGLPKIAMPTERSRK